MSLIDLSADEREQIHRCHGHGQRLADAVGKIVAARMADAWDEGYVRGRYPWTKTDQEEDPIPDGVSPPRTGKNANPYRRGAA